jgi:Family of unknown function (DUF5681)
MAFQPGQSGNPAGRPKGARDKRNVVAAEFEKEGSTIARVVVEAAKKGDMQAATLVLQRLSPPLRPRGLLCEFELTADASIAEQAKQIIAAVSRGQIEPETAKLLIDCLSMFVGIEDVEIFRAERARVMRSVTAQLGQVRGGVLTHD